MTDEERAMCIEYWRIPELTTVLESLEDCFGERISDFKSVSDYTTIQIRAYAYGIIVMKEIICLLKEGFPDGALARARRLYEQMIILDFFNQRKDKPDFKELIERYCDSQDIAAYSNRITLYDFLEQKEQKEKSEPKFERLKERYKEYFGKKNWVRDYWWTGDENFQSFNSLQNAYDEPFAKIMYSRACISTHACAIGDYALLGRSNPNGEKIYTGATYSGFSVPLILAVMSFYNTTNVVFCNLKVVFPKAHTDLYQLLEYYQKTLFVDYNIKELQ